MLAAKVKLHWDQSEDLVGQFTSSENTLQLYRFMQEALSNVIRHAKAENVNVIIHQADEDAPLVIQIEDDGIGLTHKTSQSAGKGLNNMGQRAFKLGGTYHIGDAFADSGTRITLTIPKI